MVSRLRKTYYKTFSSTKKARRAALKVKGGFTNARFISGKKRGIDVYFIPNKYERKPKGFKEKKIKF